MTRLFEFAKKGVRRNEDLLCMRFVMTWLTLRTKSALCEFSVCIDTRLSLCFLLETYYCKEKSYYYLRQSIGNEIKFSPSLYFMKTWTTYHNHWKNIHFELVCSLLRNTLVVLLAVAFPRHRMYIAADHLVETDCSVQLKFIKNGFFYLIHPTNMNDKSKISVWKILVMYVDVLPKTV